jgi:hypothetical protein
MTGISLHMQWPLTSQLHGSVSQREQLFFLLRIKLHARARTESFLSHKFVSKSVGRHLTPSPIIFIIVDDDPSERVFFLPHFLRSHVLQRWDRSNEAKAVL